MRYESQRTDKGNVGVSYISQELADAQAKAMDMGNCSRCTSCTDCTGILRWTGPATKKLLALNGLLWPITTDGINLQIGCQQHPVTYWDRYSDLLINRMEERALTFWKEMKPTIMAMCEFRRRQS